MGRDPTLLPGAQSKSGSVALWNWRSFFDKPPPRAEGAQSLEKDKEERNRTMGKYGGSGYDAAQEIIDCWSLGLTAEPEFEERFQQ
eukprot:3065895-Alexandrium_andersonii.AAC.1